MSTDPSLAKFIPWYNGLTFYKASGGPAKGTIATALVILERLMKDYDLNFESHLAAGGAQIKNASGSSIAAILKKHGELREFSKEGGRTNRGIIKEIKPLFPILESMELELLPSEERNQILFHFQAYLVDRIRDFHNRLKIKFVFDPKWSTWQTIHCLLETSQKESKAGPMCQHLVGAKLQLRFPTLNISNESATTADKQTHRAGDFEIENTVFHVTVSPMDGVFKKCADNLRDGLKVYLIVPDSKLALSRALAGDCCDAQIAVESFESFVSQNIEEVGYFSSANLKHNLRTLLELYNRRVDAVEADKSIMIELPPNLKS